MSLPQFKTDLRELQMLQSQWASSLDPVLTNPSLQSIVIPQVSLGVGSNTINHKLGRKLQGWRICRQRALANIYDTQDSNQMPNLTLVLVSDAVVVIDLEVF